MAAAMSATSNLQTDSYDQQQDEASRSICEQEIIDSPVPQLEENQSQEQSYDQQQDMSGDEGQEEEQSFRDDDEQSYRGEEEEAE